MANGAFSGINAPRTPPLKAHRLRQDLLSVNGTNDKIPPIWHYSDILWSLSEAIWSAVLTEKHAVLRCSRTTAKRDIWANPGWGEPNTSWEVPEPEDLPAVGGTGDDPWKD